MALSKLQSLTDYLQKEYGVPSVLAVVGKRFVFIFQTSENEVSAMVGTITGAILEYPQEPRSTPEEPIATLNLAIQAPNFYTKEKICTPKEMTAFMYVDDSEDSDEKLKWMLYASSSQEKYIEAGEMDETFEGEFHLLP